MKKRIISAIIALIIFIPVFIIGGKVFNIAFLVLTILGLREFMKIREKTKKYPDFIRLISYLSISFLYFGNSLNNNMEFIINYKLLAGIFLILLLPVVLYNNKEVYNVKEAFYLLGGVSFLGISMSLFNLYRTIDLKILIYLFLITILTDSYAYFTGMLIGKHKLLEDISPKKTWEGTIGGSIVATFCVTIYYLTVINANENILLVVGMTLFLSIIGQFGDLFFSAIKRTYGVKDFSNIMPGHGGILDRLDSIIFVALAFTFFIEVIL